MADTVKTEPPLAEPGAARPGRQKNPVEHLQNNARIRTTLRLKTIRVRLLVTFLLVVLLPLILIVVTSVVGGLRGGRDHIVNQLQSVTALKQAEIQEWVNNLQSTLGILLHEHEATQIIDVLLSGMVDATAYKQVHEELQADLAVLARDSGLYQEVFVLDTAGTVVLSTDPAQEGKFYNTQDFFLKGLEGPFTNPPTYEPSLNRTSVVSTRPIVDSQGQVRGILAGRASMDVLSAVMGEKAGLGETGQTYLLSKNSAVLTAVRGAEEVPYIRSDGANAAVEDHQNGEGQYLDYAQVPVVGVYRWIPDLQVALLAEQAQSEAFQSTYVTLALNVGVTVLASLAALLISLVVTTGISRPLVKLATAATAVAGGNLQQAVQVERTDEIGALGNAFNSMTAQLRETIGSLEQRNQHLQDAVNRYVALMGEVARGNLSARITPDQGPDAAGSPLYRLGNSLNEMVVSLQKMTVQVRDTATNLSSSSSEILAATTQQASGATEQSAAIAQASATIDQVRTIASQTSDRARGVADQAMRTDQVSQSGQRAVTQSLAGMKEVKVKVDIIAQNILALSEQAQAIGQIISAVNDIASQSNMLALNAAVEAARAGEAGKGFAVVAGEVRSLAEQSRAATVQVRDILSEIQRGVNTAVMATEEGIKGADAGVRQTQEAGEAIRKLAESVSESAQAAAQIAASSEQQLAGMEQIALAMQNIHQVTAQSLNSTRQSERAAEELTRLAAQLREVVEQYQL